MKHTIRQHGQLTQIDCELDSDILDKNGKEIFEGDIVEDSEGERSLVLYSEGAFILSNGDELAYIAHDCKIVGIAKRVGD